MRTCGICSAGLGDFMAARLTRIASGLKGLPLAAESTKWKSQKEDRRRCHCLRAAVSCITAPDKALLACGRAYIELALTNPALYRLMCGPALAKSTGGRPAEARRAANDARAVLEEIIHRGAQSGVFAVSPDDPLEQSKVVFFVWSVVHGLSMALLDGFTRAEITLDDLVKEIERALLKGLKPRKNCH